jgi:Retroviral aspartyl protease
VETSLGKVEQPERWCYELQVRVADRDLRLDALVLDIDRYDVLLSMDWLSLHGAIIDYPMRLI